MPSECPHCATEESLIAERDRLLDDCEQLSADLEGALADAHRMRDEIDSLQTQVAALRRANRMFAVKYRK